MRYKVTLGFKISDKKDHDREVTVEVDANSDDAARVLAKQRALQDDSSLLGLTLWYCHQEKIPWE